MAAETLTGGGEATAAPAPTPAPTPAPSPAPSPEPTPQPPAAPTGAWHEKLPENLRGEKTLHAFKDEAALAASYLEMKKWQSNALKVPGKDATPAEIAAYREKIGVPKSAAEYDLSTIGKEVVLDPGQKDAVLGFFHRELGLTNEQVQKILPWAWQRDQQQKEKLNEGYLTQLDELADQWGEHVFNRRVNQVQGLIRRFGSPELSEWLNSSKNTNNPLLLKLLYPIAAQFAEDGYIAGDVEGAPTEGELDSKIEVAREALAKMDKGSDAYNRALKAYEDLIGLQAEIASSKKS